MKLWIILHKTECPIPLNNHKQYLKLLNSAYDENFESLDKFKQENGFKRILDKLTGDET